MNYPAADTANAGRICPTCNGTGINPVATYLLCPKCNGEKAVPWPSNHPRGRLHGGGLLPKEGEE